MKGAAAQPWHRRFLGWMPPGLHRSVLRFEAAIEDGVQRFAASLAQGARVLDAGAGEGQYKRCLSHCRYIGVDLAVGDAAWDYGGLDARADLARLPFRDGCFAAVLNIVVLEHTREPGRVIAELGRVLERGGALLLVAPQEWGVHQAPYDYFRFTRYGLEWLLAQAGFERIEIVPAGGFFTLLGRRLLDSVLFFRGGWRWLALPVVALSAGVLGLLVPWLDFLDREKDSTLGYICTARKR